MKRDSGRRRVFRIPFSRRGLDRDVDAELRFHLEGRIEELMAMGMSRDEASVEARQRFGDLDSHRRELRAIDEEMQKMRQRLEFTDTVGRELKYAVRTLGRSRTFAAMAFVTLALGLGAAMAIFTILDAVVLRPLPYAHGDRLVALSSPVPGIKAAPVWGLARHEMYYFKRESHTLEDLGIYRTELATLTGDGGATQPERAPAAYVSASLFGVLGIVPERGRLLNPDDNLRATDTLDAALMSHGLWERRYAGDTTIVGKRIDLDGYPVTVVGVLPPSAQLPDYKVDLWLPLDMNPASPARSNHIFSVIGRMRRGVDIANAQRELTALTARFPTAFPNVYTPKMMEGTGFTTLVKSLRDDVVGSLVTKSIWILFAAVIVVLLIAAANVANLFLVRVETRRLEAAVRSAIGASRGALAVHSLAESLVLTGMAALGAIGVAWAGLHFLVALAPSDLPRLDEVHLGWTGFAFTIVCALVAGITLGLLPSLRGQVDLAMLREGGRGSTGAPRRLATRNILVTSQMALALILLTAAGLLVRSLRNLRGVHPGFDPTNVMTMSLSLPNGRYRSPQIANAFFEQLAARVRALPGVLSVGFGGALPLESSELCTGAVVDVPGPSGERSDCVQMMQVTPGYFETLRIPLRGHAPDWPENDRGGASAVVSEAFANRFWPNEDAINRGVKCCNGMPPFYRISGVTGPVRTHGLDRSPGQVVYFPMIPFARNPGIEGLPLFMRLVVRTAAGMSNSVLPAIRRAVNEIDPQVPISDIAPMEQLLAQSLARRSFTMMLLAAAAALALVLSAVGIYGVISYVVAQRRSEIGIRMALGARAEDVRGMVVRQSLVLAGIGVLIGLACALATTRVLGALLFGVSPNDPLVLICATLLLVILATVASYAPAVRASRVDPVEALRG
ncbi:MAG TPA: ABC transporter permease [Gemmatimonadaceae bacterium]|jgi:predicted permease